MKPAARPSLALTCGLLLAAACGGCLPSACSVNPGLRGLQADDGSAGDLLASGAGAPEGFERMTVMGVLPTAEGNAVFLVDAAEERVLPIWIGPAEAMAIRLRTERRRFERPLTHDLLESVLREMGGRVLRVHIDDLKGSTFVATVFIRANDGVIALDARPSDAIALAVGSQAPIFVASDVVDRAGLGRDDVPREDFQERSLEDRPTEPLFPRERDTPGIISPPPTQAL